MGCGCLQSGQWCPIAYATGQRPTTDEREILIDLTKPVNESQTGDCEIQDREPP